MLSFAAYRYRKVFAVDGGPIARIAVDEFPVFGRKMWQAAAWLADGLIAVRPAFAVYSSADGMGTSESPMIARHMAISEALERWAYHTKIRAPDRDRYGFEVDGSTNGMAAYPGIFQSQVRQRARLEAVERASIIAWWEGRCDGEVQPTRWPGVNALVLPSPVGYGITVLAFRASLPDVFAYGHGAATTLSDACERAVMELARHEYAISLHRRSGNADRAETPTDLLERRALFFSTPEGHALFRERLRRKTRGADYRARIVCDTEIPGPWSRYTSVWRVLIEPPSRDFLADTEKYFFW